MLRRAAVRMPERKVLIPVAAVLETRRSELIKVPPTAPYHGTPTGRSPKWFGSAPRTPADTW